ncbi:NACHT domain-containing protein [Streptomyces cavernicola]|uniref:NACHT domain-containing protein n=1 Tax=Streptomyces cavernicola TaxID=3043613 RepID=A0ABT6SH80_9ACTN|nr:NACHT domain-containing protein [Streptomyces sp. B-S-A6]MDI3407556.1 NACHT domain-containing protein [Streptomyces sp. B-S-A6]
MLRRSGPARVGICQAALRLSVIDRHPIDDTTELGFHAVMTNRERGVLALWLTGCAVAVGAVIHFGFEPVTAVLGIGGVLLVASPAKSFLTRTWAWNAEPSEGTQLDAAAVALNHAVKRHWTSEAGRRKQHLSIDRIPVRWDTLHDQRSRATTVEAPRPLPEHGSLDALVEDYAARPSRLIVVGDAGSGKTGLCVDLTLALCRPADPQRVPVLLQLSTWEPEISFQNWIVQRLTEDYRFLEDTTKYGAGAVMELLSHRRLLLVLDGLDELPPELRVQVIRTLRDNTHLPADLVLTCRPDEYAATTAEEPLPDSRLVRLLPVPAIDMVAYLVAHFPDDLDRWASVTRTLREDPAGPLADALSSPLMLFLTRASYRSRSSTPEDLLDPVRFGTREQIEDHLLDAFIPVVFDSPPLGSDDGNPGRPTREWPEEQALRALTFFANRLESQFRDGGRRPVDLSWWNLRDLAAIPRRLFVVVPTVIGAVSCCLLGLLIFGLFGRPGFGALFGAAVGLVFSPLLGLVRAEPPRRFAPRRARQHNRLVLRPLVIDLGFGLIGLVTGGLLAGLLYPVTYGVAAGLAFGLVFASARRFTRPTEPKHTVTPLRSLRDDRNAVLYAWLFGSLAGGCVGGFLATAGIDRARYDLVISASPAVQGVMGASVGALLCGVGLGLVVLSTSAWGHYTTARGWLAWRGHTPWSLASFLHDAHKLGVLRSTGAHYQFRHASLQRRLAAQR